MNVEGADNLSECEISRRLRERGLRVTHPRLTAYRVLWETAGHLSVDDLVARLRDRGECIPRMSVYNVVSDLERAGLVMQADVGPGRAIYEVAESWHHHFVCRQCGRIFDVPCAIGEKPCLDASFKGGKIDEAQVIFRGLCNECLDADG